MATTPADSFLREILSDGAEHLSEAVRAEAEARGLTWRSVERARAKLPNLMTYQKDFGGPWVIRLPQSKPQSNGTSRYPTYTPVTCLNCQRVAGMYPNPQSTTCHRCAHCRNPTQTAHHHIASQA
jgi:hypothetical protein